VRVGLCAWVVRSGYAEALQITSRRLKPVVGVANMVNLGFQPPPGFLAQVGLARGEVVRASSTSPPLLCAAGIAVAYGATAIAEISTIAPGFGRPATWIVARAGGALLKNVAYSVFIPAKSVTFTR
jgi:hypothetical protein